MISICIVEDTIDILQGLECIIRKNSSFKLLKSFTNAEEAIKEIPTLEPDIVLADINLPQKSGIECMREIKENCPDMQFIMFTIYEDSDQVFEALKAGASGYILKNTPPEKIVESLLELHEGGSPMSPKIARKVLNSFNVEPKKNHFNDLLTKKEIEILAQLSKGYLYKEIAEKEHISISTVKTHLNHIYQKLQVQNRTEAINKLYGK
ncbi:response regulator transcription factor [Flavobacterium filum]|uniref:response regulator n=1 Tax=Flavobacterium TaxID=237 RepID=UPI0023F0B98D|nr:response regulator transcription factor [Flavobacterium filum]